MRKVPRHSLQDISLVLRCVGECWSGIKTVWLQGVEKLADVAAVVQLWFLMLGYSNEGVIVCCGVYIYKHIWMVLRVMFIMVVLKTGLDTLYKEKPTLLHIVLLLVMELRVGYIVLIFVSSGLLLQREVCLLPSMAAWVAWCRCGISFPIRNGYSEKIYIFSVKI